MPHIIDENGKKLKPLGEFSDFGADSVRYIIDFCMPRALFSIRRASSAFLNLATNDADQTPYIEKRLLKICVSDDLATAIFNVASPQLVHQWICHIMPPAGMQAGVGSRLSPFTLLQETAFTSPYAVENYSVAQRISLAWHYASDGISDVLLGGVNNFGNPSLEITVNSQNISYMMNHNNYYNMMALPIPMSNDLIIQKLASLGVTLAECNKIPLQIRQFIILNQLTINRKEIDCITDKKNETLLLNAKLINGIKQLIAMSPTIQQMGGNVANNYENTGNLIKPKLSSLCILYKQSKNRIDYVIEWLKSHLQNLGIYQDPTQHAPASLSISSITYGHVNQELDSVIDLLKSDYLTADDIEASKADGYDLYMLQAKIELETAKKEAANKVVNAALVFSNIVDSNVASSSFVHKPTDELKTTTQQIPYNRSCIIQ